MKDKQPIVYVLGVEGHFHLAKALANEFNRPIVGIISCERIHEMMTPERRNIFDKIYSLPDFYIKNIKEISSLSRAALDQKQSALESSLHVNDTALLTNQDRRIRRLGGFRKIRDWQVCNLMFIQHIIDNTAPAFVIDGVITYLQLALRQACEARDIPYLLSMAARGDGFALYHRNGHQIGMNTLFKMFQKGDFSAIDSETLEEADQALQAFQDKPRRPSYAKTNSLTKLNWPVFKHKVSLAFDPKKIFPSARMRNIDLYMNAESTFSQIVGRYIRSKYRRMGLKLQSLFDESPDLSVPFIYLPLHYTPEISDLFFGTEYDHHEGFVTQLSKFIPSNYQLYVKEHTSMIGRRPNGFYKALSKLYNVKVIAPSVNTFTLIKNAQATITVTGTPGWEAFLLGKPSIALGSVFFNNLPGILHTNMNTSFQKGLTDYLKNFSPDETIIQNAYRSYYASVHKGVKVDVGYTSSRAQADAHAAYFAASVRQTIQKYHHEMQGKFPKDMTTTPAHQTQDKVVA